MSAKRFAGRMFAKLGGEDAAPEEKPLRHVAIIMDGNGRWAKERGHTRLKGHQEGVEAARRAVDAAKELGLSHMTLYSFSTENWNRPDWEVQHLMNLLRRFFEQDLVKLADEDVRVKIIGDRDALPSDIQKLVIDAEQRTADNKGHTLQIAFNYGGRDEIVRAVQKLAARAAAGEIDPAAIDETALGLALDTGDAPDPDLVIRTSGEQRLSNFLLWQAAYAEFVFLDCYWPDFDRDQFMFAVDTFRRRTRRFGARPEDVAS
ncbi:isoprenyl transferase [Parvularcula sp. LCG005]|uniref:isoprenyl transferase n=1 Tax=Parvularcula sp. LCG005 TaxID=3078805 RepID=UPI0029421BB9|nr:isoprenyl transferase [Parvularcula sp. LCG005]WOI52765.1 isoprenyl transferase [Parvularcula sp. LCG005]